MLVRSRMIEFDFLHHSSAFGSMGHFLCPAMESLPFFRDFVSRLRHDESNFYSQSSRCFWNKFYHRFTPFTPFSTRLKISFWKQSFTWSSDVNLLMVWTLTPMKILLSKSSKILVGARKHEHVCNVHLSLPSVGQPDQNRSPHASQPSSWRLVQSKNRI